MSKEKTFIPLKPGKIYCRIIFALFPLIFLISANINISESAEGVPIIKSIEIKGNKKIETETIQSKIKNRVSIPFSQETVQQDIKSLYGLGYFDDIEAEIEPYEGGIKLIFVLKEKPTVISVDFQGNKEFDANKLKEKITITTGAIANYSLITDNVEKIISFYQSEGYWHVKVIPVIKNISDDSVALTFQIDEGPKVKIKEIKIEGNKAISSKEIKKAMNTKERWLFSFITGSGIYKKEEIKADIERIRELYHSKGYIYVVISESKVTLSPDKKNIYIEISVSEGEQYTVGDMSFKENTVFGSAELYKQVKTAAGKIFNRTILRSDIDNILNLYMEKGYARADVDPQMEVNTEQKFVNITFSIAEGEIFKVGRIDIAGNQKTRDKVIRREMRLDEGDTFNSKLLRRSYQRITNLNYFESVELVPKPRAEEKLVDIDIKVKEKLTGMLTVGGGYSSVDKFIVMGEISQTNLFGKGLYLKLRGDFSSIRTNYSLTIVDPWFMDKPISASFSLYNEVFKYPDYSKQATGLSVGFGKELSEYVGGKISYDLESVNITDVANNASSLIKEQIGKKITSSISPSIWKDTRDNFLDPTTGSKNALYTTLAGLGGDNYFVKARVDSLWYFPVIWDTTFSLRGRFGYASGFAGKKLPLYERFYVGGINTVRGLGFGVAGPKNDNGERIGGNKELIFNAEYIFPIKKDIKLKGVMFFDAGKAFDNSETVSIASLRTTTGVGLRWMSPFGPIRLEWGFNISPRKDESRSKIEFAIGGLF
ncbi:MAG: outer membrane protein assembly factor BamA [Thermodesulfovibrionia bacterium]|nr:outer membrane protein assembly factor BamA [Thermodesulfovibrionia bacterium]